MNSSIRVSAWQSRAEHMCTFERKWEQRFLIRLIYVFSPLRTARAFVYLFSFHLAFSFFCTKMRANVCLAKEKIERRHDQMICDIRNGAARFSVHIWIAACSSSHPIPFGSQPHTRRALN